MKLEYNSPVILTYALLCTAILIFQLYTPVEVMPFFAVNPPGPFDFTSPVAYFQLFSHALGHANWEHLVGNFTLILLIGPILEEKYGSRDLLFMMLVTALVTGILQTAFFDHALLGASGIAFMLILLSSYTNSRNGGLPLTFVLVVILFLGKEIIQSFGSDNVSQFAHIIGGILGGVFGFFLEGGKQSHNTGTT